MLLRACPTISAPDAALALASAETCEASEAFSGQAAAFGGSFTSVNLPAESAAEAVDALRSLKNKENE